MAITYIKLGPIGDAFNSDELGIYLDKNNSTEIESSILRNRLKSFYLTGFLVEISKVEHDNINLKYNSARNIPLQIIPVTPTPTLEPVEAVLKTPPALISPGNRFLVERGATGAWEGYDDYIATFNGSVWQFTKPMHRYTLPIYNWGVSTKYSGVYPSGRWDYSDLQDLINLGTGTIGEGTGTPNPGDDNYALSLFIIERDARIKRDDELYALIKNIMDNPISSIKAIAVSIQDSGGYWNGNNVEIALQEVGERVKAQDTKILELIQMIQELGNLNLDEILAQLEALTSELAQTNDRITQFIDEFGNSLEYVKDAWTIDSPFTGDIDGVNRIFTLPTEYIPGKTAVTLNGQRLKGGYDYDEAAAEPYNTIEFDYDIEVGETIMIDYVKAQPLPEE